MKKEFWRAELIGRLLRIEELEASARGQGATFTWRTGNHNNYYFWFSLPVGEDPRVCLYCDPTLSGSTRGWLSCRKLTSEGSLKNLPDSIEEWARKDLGDKEIATDYKQTILNLLKKVPKDLASAWAKVHAALAPEEQHERREEALTRTVNVWGHDLPLNPDGTVSLYHATKTPEAAQRIVNEKMLRSEAEPSVYLSSAKSGTGYGEHVVVVHVDPQELEIDDEFPDGRVDYRIDKPKARVAAARILVPYEEVLAQDEVLISRLERGVIPVHA